LAKLLKKNKQTPLASVVATCSRQVIGKMAGHLQLCREKPYPMVIQSRRLRGGSGIPSARKSLKIVHMSDTHGKFYDVPYGDVLIHSGDFTNHGIRDGLEDLEAFVSYFKALPHQYKILVPGNHELDLDKIPIRDLRHLLGCTPGSNIFVLVDEYIIIEGIKIYGSPWTQCTMAWPAKSIEQRAERWQHIPENTDILVTHMPPYKIFDLAWQPDGFFHWGCHALLERLSQITPALHCFGHVHDEVGAKMLSFDGVEVMFSNAAMDLKKAVNTFTFEVPVEPLEDTSDRANTHLPSMHVGYLQVQGMDLVLDLDAADPQQEMVFLWKKLPGHRPNQLWQLTHRSEPKGLGGHALRSVRNGQTLRFLGSDLKASSNTFAEEMTWADGWLISPGGCTVLVPHSLSCGQVLGLAPIDLQDALRFSFVPLET